MLGDTQAEFFLVWVLLEATTIIVLNFPCVMRYPSRIVAVPPGAFLSCAASLSTTTYESGTCPSDEFPRTAEPVCILGTMYSTLHGGITTAPMILILVKNRFSVSQPCAVKFTVVYY